MVRSDRRAVRAGLMLPALRDPLYALMILGCVRGGLDPLWYRRLPEGLDPSRIPIVAGEILFAALIMPHVAAGKSEREEQNHRRPSSHVRPHADRRTALPFLRPR
jgi:hypothetical protein